ncbi:MAG TPA: hypothetical protein VFM36_12235 [Thermoanaerobaculia bacterium]|nr:hypothetical protein [Thermoanaerobaculia bacterium]
MQKNLWSPLAKGAAGFLAGLVLWFALSTPYARLLASLSEPLVRVAEKPSVTRLIPKGSELTIERSDFPIGAPRPGLALMDLTFNIILLTTLFAVNRKPLSDRNMLGLFLASLSLVVVHVVAVVTNVQSIYALRLGPWSEANYGAVARNFWGGGAHFYTVIGVFGAGFALWWLFRPPSAAPLDGSRAGRSRA